MKRPTGLEIPEIPDDLRDPIRALVSAARMYSRLIAAVADGANLHELIKDQAHAIRSAETTVELWSAHLGIDASHG